MISQVTVEALHSATYVENYLDSVENLPDDVQRHLSRIREIDVLYRNHLRDVSVYYDQWNSMNGSASGQLNGGAGSGGGGGGGSDSSQPSTTEPSNASKRVIARIQQGLIAAQELGDEKLQIVQQLQDLIDHKTRQLDQDFKNLGSDFFSRLDYNREEKLTEGQQKEIRSTSPSSACSPNNVISSPAAYVVNSGNGQSANVGGSNSGNGTAAGSGNGNYTGNSGVNSNASNGGVSGGSAAGSGGNGGATGTGAGSGSASTNTGIAERGSKRARRTRNDQNSGSANGSSTPNSGAHGQMDIDPIDTSNIKLEAGSGAGTSQTSGSGAGGVASGKGSSGQSSAAGGAGGSAAGGGGTGGGQGKKGGAGAGKKKKRKTGRGQAREAREDTPPPEETIDPDEPTYCLCDQISFGEMILCDNDLCPIEWFHFSCVALMSKPKGKWFCPNCRGDRPNVMKPKAQFLKELERYNKEKEEKT
ncbi:inhibitor of growth protein 1 homolog [Sabethes cyaneus]|uniref:inhibitor of growth protein 1 homolog n=1 Tax=Sabethes cyaneus TaxID=53552 RepID=UPI00237DE34B|nr:inhibitor of growth protein 1 homolog [Sabethes cyaneus]